MEDMLWMMGWEWRYTMRIVEQLGARLGIEAVGGLPVYPGVCMAAA
jgi:hypothetical protein